jgi:hypothetical protein
MDIKAMRRMYGEFTYPEREELAVVVQAVEEAILEPAILCYLDTRGVKGLITDQARYDLASRALTQADGFTRKVHTFKDLTRPELLYVRWWIEQCDITAELAEAGWIPVPTMARLKRLVAEADVSSRAMNVFKKRWQFA